MYRSLSTIYNKHENGLISFDGLTKPIQTPPEVDPNNQIATSILFRGRLQERLEQQLPNKL